MPTKPRVLAAAIKRVGGVIKNKSSGHKIAVHQGRKADIPFHGGGYELSDRLVDKILTSLSLSRKDVGLE
ncbi:hypothetical protein [Azospirillum thermophilum]|uniref:Addiction module toxin, HicA family n=1 Tax=Azospirillum thermophilum TaxID=2202148 RepID=A0A2S2D0P9_9PROT|nr:hypothetical protein [Azospirillum thermophilum]AWK90334.1 hypothetical protein DEW08_30425 [Azospirillum thermophilum]